MNDCYQYKPVIHGYLIFNNRYFINHIRQVIILNCPRCHTKLVEEIYSGYEVSVCSSCKGVLFPQVNLIGLIEKVDANEAIQATNENKTSGHEQTASLNCPKCLSIMSNHGYMGVESIMIDTCNECGLVWADGEELQRMSALYKDTEMKSEARRLRDKKLYSSDTLSAVLESRANEAAHIANPGFDASEPYHLLDIILLGAGFVALLLAIFWPIA